MTTTGTLTTRSNGATATVTATVTANGQTIATFTTKNTSGFVGRIDRKLASVAYATRTTGYANDGDTMVATVAIY